MKENKTNTYQQRSVMTDLVMTLMICTLYVSVPYFGGEGRCRAFIFPPLGRIAAWSDTFHPDKINGTA